MKASALRFVVAFIQPFQTDAGMSVSEIRGFAAHAAHPPRAGERSEVHAFAKALRIEVIFAGPLSLACRIRTGEWGESAVLPAAMG